jgi:hypothetical protein
MNLMLICEYKFAMYGFFAEHNGTNDEVRERSQPQVAKKMVDVRRFELPTPCLQSRLGKTLNALAGVAYNEHHRNSRSSNVPKLSQSIRIKDLTIA